MTGGFNDDSETCDVQIRPLDTILWSQRSIRVDVVGPEGEYSIRVARPFARVGSHPWADVFLDHRSVAARHWYVHAAETGLFAINTYQLLSSNSKAARWIAGDQAIEIPPFTLRFSAMPEIENARPMTELLTLPIFSQGGDEPFPVLVFYADGKPVGEYPMRRRLISIGRSKKNQVHFSTRTLSTIHAFVYRERDKVWLVDFYSRQKTRLKSREAVIATALIPGEALQMGRITVDVYWTLRWKGSQSNDAAASQNKWKSEASSLVTSALEPAIDVLGDRDSALDPALSEKGPSAAAGQHLSESVQTLKRDLEELTSQIQAGRDAKSAVEHELESMHREMETYRNECAKIKEMLAQARAELAHSHVEREALQNEMQARQQEIEQQEQFGHQRQTELDSIANELTGRAKQLQTTEAMLAAREAELEGRQHSVETLALDNRKLQQRIAQLESANQDLQQAIDERSTLAANREREWFDQLSRAQNIIEDQNKQNELQCRQLQTELDAVGMKLAKHQHELQAAHETLSNRQQLIADQKGKMDDLDAQNQRLREQVAEQLAELGEFRQLAHEDEAKQRELQQHLARAQALHANELQQAQTALGDSQRIIEDLHATIDQLHRDRIHRKTELAEHSPYQSVMHSETDRSPVASTSKDDNTQVQATGAPVARANRRADDRDETAEHLQQVVLANLEAVRRERTWPRRFWKRILLVFSRQKHN